MTSREESKPTHVNHAKSYFEEVAKNLSSIDRAIMILSGKGGVGKSVIACALALGLAMKGYRVALLDADIHGPSIPWILGLEHTFLGATLDGKLIPAEIEGIAVVSIELLLENKTNPIVWRGPMKTRALLELLSKSMWGKRDYLIVDLPPGTGDEALTIAQTLSSIKYRGALLVLTPGHMVAHIVRKAKEFVNLLGIPLLGAVLNMAYFRCPNCNTIHRLFGDYSLSDVEILCEVPIDPLLSQSVEQSRFVEFMRSDLESAKILRELSDIVDNKVKTLEAR